MRRGLSRILVVVVAALLSVGCGSTPVAQDLSQRQANEIVALLTSKGISAVAKKESGGRGLFAVMIPAEAYGTAVSLMQERGLPQEPRLSAKELLTPRGIIPSSREMEAMQLDYAIALKIEEMLQAHSSIAQARCVVRQRSAVEGQQPSASVVVETRPGVAALDGAEVARIVQSILPGLTQETLSIVITKAPELAPIPGVGVDGSPAQLERFLWLWRVPSSDYNGLALLFSGALLLVAAAATALGYWICLFQRTRETVDPNVPEVFPKSLRLDRGRKDLPE